MTRPTDHGAEEARAELADLYRALSHELRSPLGSILNFAGILEVDFGSELDPAARGVIARIRRSADSAVAVLDVLNRLAGVERGELRPDAVDLEALARTAFASVRGPELRADLTLGEPPIFEADRELLGIALEELFANAIKFSAVREKATVALNAWASDPDHVVLCVSDAGIGFDPRHGAKLFKLFERLHPRATYPGAGAGLAVVRRVVERHGGRVWAESEPDAGARFFMELPARCGVEA